MDGQVGVRIEVVAGKRILRQTETSWIGVKISQEGLKFHLKSKEG
jgi:hypothetical protein